jgi:dolichol-phosphate mannosyltransferase
MKVSVVIPAFNEEASLPLLQERLTRVMESLADYDFEIVVVDDHSTDETSDRIDEWAASDSRVRGIRFSRNFGSHVALMAGLAECTGDCAAFIAADLQDPPELLERLIGEWRDGQDIVWGVREERRGESWKTLLFAKLYWATVRAVAVAETPRQGADSVLLSRRVIDAVAASGEKNTSMLSLLMWMGFRQTRITYVKGERAAGASGWTFAKRLKLAIDSVVSFSTFPIRVTWLAGLAFCAAAVVWAIAATTGRWTGLLRFDTIDAVLLGIVLLGFGLLLTCVGVMGEYVWRAYDEARDRPRFIIERRFGSPATRQADTSSACCRCGPPDRTAPSPRVPAVAHTT